MQQPEQNLPEFLNSLEDYVPTVRFLFSLSNAMRMQSTRGDLIYSLSCCRSPTSSQNTIWRRAAWSARISACELPFAFFMDCLFQNIVIVAG